MLILYTKDGTRCSNAILYGGDIAIIQDEPTHIYLVESDFGNRIRLTWKEIEERYTIGPVSDHREWTEDRKMAIRKHDDELVPFEMTPNPPTMDHLR